MNGRLQHGYSSSLKGRITMMFAVLAAIMEGLLLVYWVIVLEPRLEAGIESNIRSLAQSQTLALSTQLSEPDIDRNQLIKLMENILLLRDPSSEMPLVLSVALEMDYEVVDVEKGFLDLSRQTTRGQELGTMGYEVEVPIFSNKTNELLGIAKFHGSKVFFLRLKKDVKTGFLIGTVCILLLLFFSWWSVLILLRPLNTLANMLRHRGGDVKENLPELKGVVSNEVLLIKSALDELFSRIRQDTSELRSLRNYLANIIDSMPSVLIGVDEDGNVTQWNRKAQQVTGISPEAAKGRPIQKVFPMLTGKLESVKQAIRMRQVYADPRQVREDENQTWFEDVTIYPLAANGVEGAVIRVDDVTEQVRMEEMMVQSEKMLSVGGLAAGMAHEINNPLAAIMQTAQVLRSRLSDPDMPANVNAAEAIGVSMDHISTFMEKRGVFRMVDAINDSGQRMAGVVDNMLSFARKTDTIVSSHHPGQLMDKIVELASTDYDLKKQYDFKAIKIQKEYEDDLPVVPCEGAKIQQVILNILRNGAQAMLSEDAAKDVPPCFSIKIFVEKEKRMLRMDIEDNGPGMDDATCKRIFEPFFTTKPVGIGTGLGLSVSYFIIKENHGGDLQVESKIGSGTKFIIRLPIEGKAIKQTL